MAHPELEWNIL